MKNPSCHRTHRFRLTLLAVAVGAALPITFNVSQAAVLNWAPGGVSGGSGNWDVSTLNWNGGTAAWSNTAPPNDAVFGGSDGTITLTTPISVGNLTFNSGNFGLDAGQLTLAGIGGSKFTTGAGVTATINSAITGTAPLVKSGAGTLNISNIGNSYSGGTVISQGTLIFGSGVSPAIGVNNKYLGSGVITLGDANTGGGDVALLMNYGNGRIDNPSMFGNDIVVSSLAGGQATIGSTFFDPAASGPAANGSVYDGTITLQRDVTLQGGNADRTTYAGKLTGIGNIQIAGGRTSFTNATNDFLGTLTIAPGAYLELDSGSVLPSTTDVTIKAGGRLSANGETIKSLNGEGVFSGSPLGVATTLTLGANNGSGSFAGEIQDAGGVSLVKTGTGTQTLTGNNTYTGGTTISGGTLQVGDGGITGSIVGDVVDNSSFVFNRSDDTTFGGEISGTGTVTKGGAGTQTLSGNNTYTGGTTISGGTLQVGDGGTTGSIVGDVVDNSSLVFNRSDDTAFGGAISGTGTVTKRGAGTLNISNIGNSYSGGTVVSQGTLVFGAGVIPTAVNNFLGTGPITLGDSVTGSNDVALLMNYGNGGSGDITVFGNDITVSNLAGGQATIGTTSFDPGSHGSQYSSTITLQRDVTLQGGNIDRTSYIGKITGIGNILIAGRRTTFDNSSNDFIGTVTVAPGALLQLNKRNVLPGTTDVTIKAGGRLDTAGVGSDQTIKSLNGEGTFVGSPSGDATTLTLGANNGSGAFAGEIQDAGGVSLVKTGTGTQTLTGNNTYTGGTTISGGTLQVGDGGTTGSIVGDVVDNATLIFNRSDDTSFGGAISGTGILSKLGAGAATLSGNSSAFSGHTDVTKGSLLVDGSLGNSSSTVSVSSGGALGGHGTIGGSVAITDGVLAPGSSTTPGTLTINGDLSLTSASQLNYKFGQAGTVGGALNDLTAVGGNLTLGGTLNVATSAGGTFGPGLYRVMSYNGALTNNGLTVGTQPAGSTAVVQTSVAHQVNLVNRGNNEAGQVLNFWDGATAPRNNGAVDGGDGVWQASLGNDNWTDVTGAGNAPYANGGFSIFSAAPGTVTVDNSQGAVVSGGMQFASNGYVVQGDPITLAAGSNVMRVGDGTNPGAAYLANVVSVLRGTGGIDKTDLGKLILTGTNSYTGGTIISAGTLQVGNGGTTGSIVGNVTNNAALIFNRSDNVAFDGAISGSGAVTKLGAGTHTLTGNSTYTGGTTISGGTLQVGNGGTTGSIVGNVTNDAALIFNRSDDVAFDGAISGTGAVTKLGAGTQTVTGDNTYTGGTTISAGALQVGNGGTTGSIVGNVINNAALIFNRSNNIAFGGEISGTGTLSQLGGGATTLSGNSSAFAGNTSVTKGSLLVDGSLGNSSSTVSVSSGGTLGGHGTIGGSVAISDGVLSPGSTTPGTLTINGDLSLTSASLINYKLGQAGTVGGAFNDLTAVGGDLTLGGTINVAPSAGGTFGPGLYRVLSYGGTLTNNGLTVGTQPAGSTAVVQTSVANQVNLVNTAGLTLNFWDGATAPRNNGAIDGGDGVWQASLGNDNWTNASGAVNAPYANGMFSIFSAAPGTVTVDNSQGAVVSGGMQFATSGYVVKGDPITLAAGSNLLRVGDGTAPGAGYVANVESALTGSGGLDKTDLGKLILTGTNSYTGGTTVSGGALQLGDGGTTGSIVGNVTNNAALIFNRSDDVAFDGAISGSGAVTKVGAGTHTLTGNNTYTGGTTISGGTLQVGNGGTTGAIVGNVTNNAALIFNRSDNITFGGAISGTGTLSKLGGGVTTLSGNSNTFAGSTSVTNGSLLVDGNLGNNSSTVRVSNGATLGGRGTIGGSVAISDGVLAPGSSTIPGTLTINGDLSLTGASQLNYKFGQAGTVGGALNDLTTVGGNLTLAGTLNVATSAGGTFGPGLYRVFNYGGTLTNNGLTLGTRPAGDAAVVQTSVAHQVNLVKTGDVAGQQMNFWDGATAPRNNGAIDGGNGIWQASLGNDNWTEATGAVNGPYANGAFSIFSAAPGTVTVDNSRGAVVSGGMQFATNGYVVKGDPITLAAGSNLLRVGDGTAPGAGYVANVESALTGTGGVDKTDLGKLILTGTNSYTGGTTVSAGALQLGNGGTTGSITGNVTNNAALIFNRSDDVAFGGVISGTGGVTKSGANTLALTGINTYTGATNVAAGTLRSGGANTLSAASAYTVAAGATLDTHGVDQNVAALSNSGIVSLAGQSAGSTLTTKGNYVGKTGLLKLGTVLNGSTSVSDRLVLDGAAAHASGNTAIQITNLNGLGALTTGNGIEVVSGINGATTTAQTTKSAFSLAEGHVDAGAYEYRLYAADSTGAGENWYLRSSAPVPPGPKPDPKGKVTFRVEVPLINALPAQLRQMDLAMLGNLQRRVGDERQQGTQGSDPQTDQRRVWGRAVHSDLDIQQSGVAQAKSNGQVNGLQVGADLFADDNWRAGAYVGYLDGNAEVSGNARGVTASVGKNNLHSRYLGAYATWTQDSGLYVDSVVQGGNHHYDVRPDISRKVSGKANSVLASMEVGKPFALTEHWSLEPQAQLVYQRNSLDNMTLTGARVHSDAADGWLARVGARVKGDIATDAGKLQPYTRVNFYQASSGEDKTTFHGPAGTTTVDSASGYKAAELAVGGTLALTPSTSLFGEVGRLWYIGGDTKVESAAQASLGLKVLW